MVASGQWPGVMERGSAVPSMADVVVRFRVQVLMRERVLGEMFHMLVLGIGGGREGGVVGCGGGVWSGGFEGGRGVASSSFGKLSGVTLKLNVARLHK